MRSTFALSCRTLFPTARLRGALVGLGVGACLPMLTNPPLSAQLRPAEAVVLHQGVAGVPGELEAGDGFGMALATGDFDGDGAIDLAVGAPYEAVGAAVSSGAVNVFYPGAAGLLGAGSSRQYWRQGSPGVPSAPESGDLWGNTLAAGDFNADGYADLAIGAPFESVGTVSRAGAVTVLYGSANRLGTTGVQTLHQDASDQQGTPLPVWATADAFFGAALASGDFDGDGYGDLAIGCTGGVVPLAATAEPGTVQVLYGSVAGLAVRPGNGSGLLSLATFGQTLGVGDGFGSALAAADFDQDGDSDLAIGIPGRNGAVHPDVGGLVVVAGSVTGLADTTMPVVDLGVAELAVAGVRLGTALSTGNFDGDDFPDLAVGRPGQPGAAATPAGRVDLWYGNENGLLAGLDPRRNRLDPTPETLHLGRRLASGDFDGDGRSDLAISARHTAIADYAGALDLRPSDAQGPRATAALAWQGLGGVPGEPLDDEHFGMTLAAADLTGDGVDDLIIGAPGDVVEGLAFAGTVTLIPGAAPTCVAGADSHCLEDARFRVSVEWETLAGASGEGQVVEQAAAELGWSASSDSGLFWFFAPNNWEMLVKVVDGCGFNDRFWVFAAATTNVGYTLRVEDTRTGMVRTFSNPLGEAAQALADIDAFATCTAEDGGPPVASVARAGTTEEAMVAELADLAQLAELAELTEPGAAPRTATGLATDATATTAATAATAATDATTTAAQAAAVGPAAALATCSDGETSLCLGENRFALSVSWRTAGGATGSGKVVPLGTADSGLFWFFQSANWELLVKVLDGCALNDHFWVFSAATTNVEYELRVRDTWTGDTRIYRNPQGLLARAVTDTAAFAGCGASAPK